MKKTYIKPTIETVNISAQNLMAASGGPITFSDDDEGYGELDDEYASGSALSKKSMFELWGD